MVHADGFDESQWGILSVGYIPKWESGKSYEVDVVVTRGSSMLRCILAHTSAAFDNTERNNWEVIAGKGAIIPEWKPNTEYGIDEVVIYEDSIYCANANHVSGEQFKNDMHPGAEKWRAVGAGGGSLGGIQQVTKLGVTAPKIIDIPIERTDTFARLPVEVLKFTPGPQDIITTVCAFDNADAKDFVVDGESGEVAKYVEFDGSMKPRTTYEIAVSKPVPLENGYISESDEIDFADYKKVTEVW